MTLFYIGGYSMEEVATFLEVPVSTIKGRLHSARERLRTMLLDTVADDLRARRPSRNESFATDGRRSAEGGTRRRHRAREDAAQGRSAIARRARSDGEHGAHHRGEQRPRCAGRSALRRRGRARLARSRGDWRQRPRDRAALDRHPEQLDTYSPEGFTPLALAAHFGHLEVMRLLIDRGADVNRVATHRLAVTPLHAALFGRQVEAALLLDRAWRRRHARARRVGLEARRLDAAALRGRHGLRHARAAAARSRRRSVPSRRRGQDAARCRDRRQPSRHCRRAPFDEVRNDEDPSFS